MHDKKLKIAILTNILPTYREGFYDRLFTREDLSVTVYCQNHIHGMNLRTIHEKYGDRIKIVKFISARKEKIAWQFLPWREIFKNYDVVFVGGNPRVLSDLLISTALHFSGKNIVHWTMAHSFRANALTEKLRLLWSRLFKIIFVYTDAEGDFLRSMNFKNHFILGMNNGLDQKRIDEAALKWTASRLQEWRHSNALENKVLLLSCARLEAKNKFEQVILALPSILNKVPNLVWCIIGAGDEQDKLVAMAKTSGLENHVRFVGEIYQEDELAPWFLSSEILVHPAAIGLTLLHSFGYGLPVVTHDSAGQHGPEYAAFEQELTGRNFNYGDATSLAAVIIDLLKDEELKSRMKEYVIRVVREEYNVDVMVERFAQIARRSAAKIYKGDGMNMRRKIRSLYRTLRRLPAVACKKDCFFRPDRKIANVKLGTEYGGWNVATEMLNAQSVIYSFGIGEDISFDLDAIEYSGANVHAFDPTPTSLTWLKKQTLPPQLIIHEYGLADFDGNLVFYPPKNHNHISHSIIPHQGQTCGNKLPVKKLSTIMNELKHDTIDLLKMDIEGSEYGVIENLLAGNVRPSQLLVEFHHRFSSVGIEKTKTAVALLKSKGYKIFSVSDVGEEFCFIYEKRNIGAVQK